MKCWVCSTRSKEAATSVLQPRWRFSYAFKKKSRGGSLLDDHRISVTSIEIATATAPVTVLAC
jgi:hypothetical protein